MLTTTPTDGGTTMKDEAYRPHEGFRRVAATQEEIAAWRSSHNGRHPSQHRLECETCHTRIWGSGLGIGSHRRRHGREQA